MTKLEEAEKKGRNNFEKFLNKIGITDYSFPENLQSIFDCEFQHKDNNYIVEIKHRSNKYASYNDLLLEKKKRDNLKKISDERGCKVLYVHTYENSNQIKISNITDKSFEWKEDYQKRSQLWDTSKVNKLICYVKDYFKTTID